jgi:hypothetical protein
VKFASFLSFIISHNEAIIQWLLAIIVGSATFLFFKELFGKKEEAKNHSSDASTLNVDEVQNILQKILDQTANVGRIMTSDHLPNEPAPAIAASSAALIGDPAEVAALRELIKNRDDEISLLKADPSAEKLKSQQARLSELENKLSEYEILEDDIADLSLYKEENARLKIDLEKARIGAITPAVAEAQPLVKEENSSAEIPSSDVQDTGDPMSDFASAIDIDKGVAPSAAEMSAELSALLEGLPGPAAEVSVPKAEVVELKAEEVKPIAQNEAAMAAPQESPPRLADVVPIHQKPVDEPQAPEGETSNLFAEFSGNLDTDRVMEELVTLEGLPAADPKDALEESLDTDKVVAEAAGFKS